MPTRRSNRAVNIVVLVDPDEVAVIEHPHPEPGVPEFHPRIVFQRDRGVGGMVEPAVLVVGRHHQPVRSLDGGLVGPGYRRSPGRGAGPRIVAPSPSALPAAERASPVW